MKLGIAQPSFETIKWDHSPVRAGYDLESRLHGLREVRRLFPPGILNRLCSAPISTFIWQITDRFPNRMTVPLFEALEAYVGPIAGDKTFSRRMDAVTHTVWLFHSLARLANCKTLDNAVLLFGDRGINGLADACPAIVELARLYNSLNNNDKRLLLITTLLHDIGKATGNRERHPHVGLDLFRRSPALKAAVAATLSSCQIANRESLLLIESTIGEHDLIGGLAITRDRSIFECADAITMRTASQSLREKILAFVTLVNFADIDAQSERGIFTDDKLSAFDAVVTTLRGLIAGTEKKDLPAWGRQRFLAWSGGDTPGFSASAKIGMLNRLLPNVDEKNNFLRVLGEISLFDGMYNLATAIHDPAAVIKFLIWIADIVGRENVQTITYDNSFILSESGIAAGIARAARDERSF
ncbi:MAG: HD domain-containing protein, partial [Candidatus Margulisbacteria bacterium]|nr:HD domain-containing protein [Candidatus Margulisiibacteriota bacterium]